MVASGTQHMDGMAGTLDQEGIAAIKRQAAERAAAAREPKPRRRELGWDLGRGIREYRWDL